MNYAAIAWALGWLAACDAQAQGRSEQPMRGVKYAEDKPASIFYECRTAGPGAIKCKLTELNIWKPHRGSSLEQRFASVFSSSPSPSECARAEQALEASKAGKPGSGEWAEAMHEACTTGDAGRLRDWARNEHERLQRTCLFDAHSFEQTFRRVSSGDPQQIVWSIGGKPSGECGIVREARFVGRVSEGSPFIDWHYRVEWRATNESARQGSLQCSDLKGVQETFAAEARAQRVDCDTVYFENGCNSPDFPCLGEGPVVVQ